MGAPLGSGRNHSFGYIKGLRESECFVIKALLGWNHQSGKATPRAIASKTEIPISRSAVSEALYHMSNRGIVRKSVGGSWHIAESIKEGLIEELKLVASEQVPSDEQESEDQQELPSENALQQESEDQQVGNPETQKSSQAASDPA